MAVAPASLRRGATRRSRSDLIRSRWCADIGRGMNEPTTGTSKRNAPTTSAAAFHQAMNSMPMPSAAGQPSTRASVRRVCCLGVAIVPAAPWICCSSVITVLCRWRA